MMRSSRMPLTLSPASHTSRRPWLRVPPLLLLTALLLVLCAADASASAAPSSSAAAAEADTATRIEDVLRFLKQRENSIRYFPRRTQEEAAVLEWGHSAIITALDAAVAHFGPQTTQAALLEVEAMPVLASPLNGVKLVDVEEDDETSEAREVADADTGDAETKERKKVVRQVEQAVKVLDNADEVHGNLVVMTNRNQLTGVQMAKIAQDSGAAAVVVVNVEGGEERPEDMYRLPLEEGHEQITIPTLMISLNSANSLTSATVTAGMKPSEIVNHGMPDRVRLYAGGDRPFFEDVEASYPTVYLIHNLLTGAECESLVKQAAPLVESLTVEDSLQHVTSTDVRKRKGISRVMLWQGMLHSPARKAIEERIEQVTGFPADHFSDFVVDRYEGGSYWLPHYDTAPDDTVPVATITVFLSVSNEKQSSSDSNISLRGDFVFPITETGEPLAIRPIKGLAVVHHNADEANEFDEHSLHAQLPPDSTLYVATKYIFATPVSKARRTILPLLAMANGGRLPRWVSKAHSYMVGQFGYQDGGTYFDKLCIFAPMLVLLSLVQYAVEYANKHFRQKSPPAKAAAATSTTGGSISGIRTPSDSQNSKRSKTEKKKV